MGEGHPAVLTRQVRKEQSQESLSERGIISIAISRVMVIYKLSQGHQKLSVLSMRMNNLAGPPSEPGRTLSQYTSAQTSFLCLPLSAANCCVTLGKALNLSELQFPQLTNRRRKWWESSLILKSRLNHSWQMNLGNLLMNICLLKMCTASRRIGLCCVTGHQRRQKGGLEGRETWSFFPPSLSSCFPAFLPFTKVTLYKPCA